MSPEMVKVKFHTLFRRYAGTDEVDVDVDRIDILGLLAKIKDILNDNIIFNKVIETDGTLRKGIIFLVNSQNILDLDNLNTVVKDNDVVSIFPPAGGG